MLEEIDITVAVACLALLGWWLILVVARWFRLGLNDNMCRKCSSKSGECVHAAQAVDRWQCGACGEEWTIPYRFREGRGVKHSPKCPDCRKTGRRVRTHGRGHLLQCPRCRVRWIVSEGVYQEHGV